MMANSSSSSSLVSPHHHHRAADMTATAPGGNNSSGQSGRMAVFANVNSRSLSLASISSEGSCESHTVEQEDIIALTQDVRSFKVQCHEMVAKI
jgi:hypothetical protein